jgi:uncharacterized SAM-binding protein YcdF (DUF218 family)
MFFGVSKFLVHFERPGDFLLLLLAAGVILLEFSRTRRAGMLVVTGVTVLFLAIAVLPVARWVGAPLERRFPQPSHLPSHVDGVIVLGGAIDPKTTGRRGIPALNAEADRMTQFLRLARLYPEARLVFSGGGYSRDPKQTEAWAAQIFFRQQGLDLQRILFEDRSLDTYENALFSKALVQPRPGQVWLLIATAEDVPRCMGVFRKLGWPVIPVPVAYKADFSSQNFAANLRLLDNSVHEWLGLLAYRLDGRTDALFPAPVK